MMNNMEISTDPTLLSVQMPSLTASSSVITFMPDEESSTCPLLRSNTSPSPPLEFSHPLTPGEGNGDVNGGIDQNAETSSSDGSGIDIVTQNGTNGLFHNNYQNLLKNGDIKLQENGYQSSYQNGNLNISGTITKCMDGKQCDMPSFVNWNWPVIRKCTFFVFLSAIFGMCAIVVAMIVSLPKTCNPPTVWYKGSVFYEVFPASFQDSNRDGIGDLNGIANRIDYLKHLGIGVVRLNSIFPSKNYPDHFEEVTTLLSVDEVLGKVGDVVKLSSALRAQNISLILDIPVYPFITSLNASHYIVKDTAHHPLDIVDPYTRLSRSLVMANDSNVIADAMKFWLSKGVSGFYLKGLEHLVGDPHLVDNFKEWQHLLGPDHILMVSETLLEQLGDKYREEVVKVVDLVDVFLNVTQDTDTISDRVKSVLAQYTLASDGMWLHWSVSGANKQTRIASHISPNMSLAVTLMELMLPGSINIFYGDEISMTEYNDPLGDHKDTRHLHHLPTMAWNSSKFTTPESLPWLPRSASVSYDHMEYIVDMIQLRKRSPSIYQNSLVRDYITLSNTNIRSSINDLFIVERWYPRRNSFVSITNFSDKKMTLDLTSMFYSGKLVLGSTAKDSKVYFENFEINSLETVVVRLDK